MAANKACTATHHDSLLSRNNFVLDTIRRRHAHSFSMVLRGVSLVTSPFAKQTGNLTPDILDDQEDQND